MIQFPLSKCEFSSVEASSYATATMTCYKSVIGRNSNYTVNAAKPFSFKLPGEVAFAQTKLNSSAFRNGFALNTTTATENNPIDFIEDSSNIYFLTFLKGTNYISRLVKVTKSSLLDGTGVYTYVNILSSGSATYVNQIASDYHRMLCQDTDNIFVLFCNHVDGNDIRVVKIRKSDLTVLGSVTVNTAAFASVLSRDIDIDDSYVYFIFSVNNNIDSYCYCIDKTNFSATASSITFKDTCLKNCVIVENNVILLSGFTGGSTVYTDTVLNTSGTIAVVSTCASSVLSSSTQFLSTAVDRTYNNSKVFHKCYETINGTSDHRIKKLFYGRGLTDAGSGSDGFFSIEAPEDISASDFNVVSVFNYGSNGANGQYVFSINDTTNELRISIDSGSNILVEYGAVGGAYNTIASGYGHNFRNNYGAPRYFQTIALSVSRTAGTIAMDINGEACVVNKDPLYGDTTIALDKEVSIELGTSDDTDFVYRSLFASFAGIVLIDSDFSYGKVPSNSSNFSSQYAVFDVFENTSDADYAKRITAKDGYLYSDASTASNNIKIARYSYDLSKTKVISSDLDSFASTGDSVIKVIKSDDGYVYFMSTMDYITGYDTMNISRMFEISEFGTDRFSFACNATSIDIKFAPLTTGDYVDFLEIKDINDANLQQFLLVGSCYAPEIAYVTKYAIIKTGEGHEDFIRKKETPSTVSIDYYSRAESGYVGTKYSYNAYNASFTASSAGLYKKTTKTLPVQDEGETYNSWLDTINMFYDPQGALLKNVPIAIMLVSGVSAMKAEIYFALDTNYAMNSEKNLISLGDANDTGLITNASPCISARKQVEVVDVTGFDPRVSRSIKFRIKANTENKFDDFRMFEIRYTPNDAFFIGGDNAEN